MSTATANTFFHSSIMDGDRRKPLDASTIPTETQPHHAWCGRVSLSWFVASLLKLFGFKWSRESNGHHLLSFESTHVLRCLESAKPSSHAFVSWSRACYSSNTPRVLLVRSATVSFLVIDYDEEVKKRSLFSRLGGSAFTKRRQAAAFRSIGLLWNARLACTRIIRKLRNFSFLISLLFVMAALITRRMHACI
jgi:hypothetical protein